MEVSGVKIDFTGLAMLVTALTAAYSTWRGMERRKKTREDAADAQAAEERKEGNHDKIPD